MPCLRGLSELIDVHLIVVLSETGAGAVSLVWNQSLFFLDTTSITLLLVFGQRAANGTRTRDTDLGKVALYQLSYSRISTLTLFLLGLFRCPLDVFLKAGAEYPFTDAAYLCKACFFQQV